MKKIWRIRKQLMACCLVVVLVLSIIFVPTKKAYAIAGVDDAAFILAMLAAAGAGFVGYSSYNSGNSNLAEDLWGELDNLEDDISDAFDKAVFKVLEGGGGGSDPNDFDPDNDDPEKKPTTWEKLKEWWKKHPNKALSLATSGSILGAVSTEFQKSLLDNAIYNFGDLQLSNITLQKFVKYINDYPHYVITYNPKTLVVDNIYMYHDFYFYYKHPTDSRTWTMLFGGSSSLYISNPSGTVHEYDSELDAPINRNKYAYTPKKFIYDTREEGYANRFGTPEYSSNLNPDSTLKTDAAKKAQEDEEKKDKPVYDNVVLPTQDQMTNYANQLQAIAQSDAEPAVKKEQQQQAMNTFVESITNVKEMPKPDPSPDPDPSPNPDPSPDPDPSPEPDPDAPATDAEAAPYTADLTTVFPFCIPFDLIRAFKVLSAEGEAPVYKMPLKIDYKSIHVSEAWQIDMSDFASVIQILRVMETLGFIVGLILVTRKLIRG